MVFIDSQSCGYPCKPTNDGTNSGGWVIGKSCWVNNVKLSCRVTIDGVYGLFKTLIWFENFSCGLVNSEVGCWYNKSSSSSELIGGNWNNFFKYVYSNEI